MNYRLILIVILISLLAITGSAFKMGGGGSFIVYQQYNVSEINALLATNNFPTLKSQGIGKGGFGYGRISANYVAGGEGYSFSVKEKVGNKTSNIIINAGGFYLARQVNLAESVSLRVGGTIGSFEKALILREESVDPIQNREYSKLTQDGFLFKPQLNLAVNITPFAAIEIGLGKSFLFNTEGDSLDSIKVGNFPDVSLAIVFGL